MLHDVQRISVFLIAAGGLLAQTTSIPNPAPGTTFTSAMAGIAQGQAARFNMLNVAAPSSVTTAICAASVTFYDAAGAVLKMSNVTAAAGAAGHLDLFSDADLELPVDQRKDIRVAFTLLAVPAPTPSTAAAVAPVCNPIGNLEVFDEITGRTQFVVGAMHAIPEAVTATPAVK